MFDVELILLVRFDPDSVAADDVWALITVEVNGNRILGAARGVSIPDGATSVPVTLSIGISHYADENTMFFDSLVGAAEAAGFSMTLAAPEHRTFILMIQHDDPPGAVKHLASHGIIVDYRPGHVRVSPHFYTTPEELDRCLDVLSSYSG